MNRRIRQYIRNLRTAISEVDKLLKEMETKFPDEEPTEVEEITEEMVNWTTADDEPVGTYLKDLKDMTTLKDVIIYGQIKTLFDLKSYVKKDDSSGLLYRIVLTDPTSDVTVIAFDEMATKLKEYTVGQYLKITNAWKMQENKHGKMELHVGNFAKIEVVE